TATVNGDGFLAKYSATGTLVWATKFDQQSASAVAIAPNFNGPGASVLLTGITKVSNGQGGLTSVPIVSKFTSDGTPVWSKLLDTGSQLGGGGLYIATDSSGNVYTAGTTSRGTGDFDPGPGVFNLTNSSGNANTFISKLDPAGNFVWAKQFANNPAISAGVWPEGLAIDGNNRVYVTGIFVGQASFDPNHGSNFVSTVDVGFPSGDAYVARLNASGNLDYLTTMGSTGGRDDGTGIAVDAAGNAYVTGQYSTLTGSAPTPFVIAPAVGVGASLPLAGGEDIYVMKLDSSGGLAWADHLGGPSFDGGSAISLTPGGVYVAGFYTGNIDFDPGAGTVHLPAGGGGTNDDFILQLTTDGGFLNGWTYGGSDYEFANSMDVSSSGVIGGVGRTDGSGDFEPGPGVATLTNHGGEDGYVVLFNPQSLSVSASPNSFSEAAGAGASTGTVTRTGDLSQSMTVQLTSSDTTEATVPVFVTIPASQSSATFPIAAVDDSIPDGPQTVTISASANASSAPQLDPTFGVGGLAPTSLRQSLQFPHEAIAYLPSGQVLAASEQTAT